MHYKEKSKEELLIEIQDLHGKYNSLKQSVTEDAIARIRAEEALQISEERYKLEIFSML